MTSTGLPAPHEQNSEMVLSSSPNTTQTDQQSPVDRCRLEKDALRGILMELKRGVKVMQERQDALHKCMTGRSLTDTQPQAGFDSVKTQMTALAEIVVALDRIAFATGIKIE